MEASAGRIQSESEWHHVGSHGKKSGLGVMIVPRGSQGGRPAQLPNRSHGRRSSQVQFKTMALFFRIQLPSLLW